MIKRRHTWSEQDQEEGIRCSDCGALLHTRDNSNQGWLLESLKTVGGSSGPYLCPACRRRHNARRIGALVSVRM